MSQEQGTQCVRDQMTGRASSLKSNFLVALQEDGQCGFFQWQDQPPRKQQVQGTFHSGEQQNSNPEDGGNLQGPQTPECRCGLEAIEITSNSAANPGRVFYKCPKNEVRVWLLCATCSMDAEQVTFGHSLPQKYGSGKRQCGLGHSLPLMHDSKERAM